MRVCDVFRSGLGACRALGIEAKIWMGEGGFRRFCRVIAGSIAQESGEIRTVQTDLQPIVPKSDRLPVSACGFANQLSKVVNSVGAATT